MQWPLRRVQISGMHSGTTSRDCDDGNANRWKGLVHFRGRTHWCQTHALKSTTGRTGVFHLAAQYYRTSIFIRSVRIYQDNRTEERISKGFWPVQETCELWSDRYSEYKSAKSIQRACLNKTGAVVGRVYTSDGDSTDARPIICFDTFTKETSRFAWSHKFIPRAFLSVQWQFPVTNEQKTDYVGTKFIGEVVIVWKNDKKWEYNSVSSSAEEHNEGRRFDRGLRPEAFWWLLEFFDIQPTQDDLNS